MKLRGSFVAALLAVGFLASAAQAQMYMAHLDGKSEVPPKETKGTGDLQAKLDPATKTLTYTLTYSGLSSPVTAAHFHGPASPGTNAGVVLPIPHATKSPVKGRAKLTDAQIADLEAGKLYVNVHTKTNPGGEIRGQVMRGGM
jgi:hypothetical protein